MAGKAAPFASGAVKGADSGEETEVASPRSRAQAGARQAIAGRDRAGREGGQGTPRAAGARAKEAGGGWQEVTTRKAYSSTVLSTARTPRCSRRWPSPSPRAAFDRAVPSKSKTPAR